MKTKKIIAMSLCLALLISLLPANIFADEPSSWAKAEVTEAYDNGFIPDELNSNFKSNIKRDEFCLLLVKYIANAMERWEYHFDGILQNSFTDINENTNKGKAVVIAKNLGIINGRSESIFSPNDDITRQEASKMMANTLYFVTDLYTNDSDFEFPEYNHEYADDSSIAEWAKSHVYLCWGKGIMKGVGNNMFNPKGMYTREQSFMSFLRLEKSLYDEDSPQPSQKTIEQNKPQANPQNNQNSTNATDAETPNTEVPNTETQNVETPAQETPQSDAQKNNSPQEKSAEEKIAELKAGVFRLVNEERAKLGIPALKEASKEITQYADLRASELKQIFSHTRPDGTSCFSGLESVSAAGENIAAGQTTAEIVMHDWMNSKGHKRNILERSFKYMAIGFDDYHWVQIFYTK